MCASPISSPSARCARSPFATALLALFAVVGWTWAIYQHFIPQTEEVKLATTKLPPPSPRARAAAGKPLEHSQPQGKSAEASEMPERTNIATNSATLAAAMDDALSSVDPVARMRKLIALLDQMRPEDAQAVNEAICARIRKGQPLQQEYAAFLSRWGALDAAGALAYFANGDPLKVNAFNHRDIITGWASVDPQAAMKWVGMQSQGQPGWDAWDCVYLGWLSQDAAAAEAYLLASPPDAAWIFSGLTACAQNRLYRGGLAEMAEWLATVPASDAFIKATRLSWSNLSQAAHSLSYEQSASIFSAVASSPWCGFGEFVSYSQITGSGSDKPDGMKGFYDALVKTWPPKSIAARFKEWSTSSPDAVRTWLETAPDCALTQAARAGVTTP